MEISVKETFEIVEQIHIDMSWGSHQTDSEKVILTVRSVGEVIENYDLDFKKLSKFFERIKQEKQKDES